MRVKRARILAMSALAVLGTVTLGVAVNVGNRMRREVVAPKTARVEAVPRSSVENKVGNTMVKGKPMLLAKAGKLTFAPGEPIILKLTLSNQTDAEIYIVETGSGKDNELEIKKASSGEKLPLSEKGKKRLESPVLRRFISRIGPGQVVHYEIDVSDLYDLTANGAYIVTVKRRILLQDKKKFAAVESKPVTVIIQ